VSSAADTLVSVPQTISIAVGAILVSQVNYRYLLATMAAVVTLAAAYLLTRKEQWVRQTAATFEEPGGSLPEPETIEAR
jgi:uncharacterized membrane protein YfcA